MLNFAIQFPTGFCTPHPHRHQHLYIHAPTHTPRGTPPSCPDPTGCARGRARGCGPARAQWGHGPRTLWLPAPWSKNEGVVNHGREVACIDDPTAKFKCCPFHFVKKVTGGSTQFQPPLGWKTPSPLHASIFMRFIVFYWCLLILFALSKKYVLPASPSPLLCPLCPWGWPKGPAKAQNCFG